jgi:hypothetical protein
MSTKLSRIHFNPEGANKYHLDCEKLRHNPNEKIDVENYIKNENDITILKSIITDESITSKHKHIVVKIGKVNKIIEKEFMISKTLENAKIPGFIHYMCFFQCYDNTYQIIQNSENIQNIKLCKANKDDNNHKSILIMPYIMEGSIKKTMWSSNKYNILKSVISQVLLSSLQAYQICGFIHNDLHLDNILLKKTKKESIKYKFLDEDSNNNIDIKTFGYKVVIMDFDSSFINVVQNRDNDKIYWNGILNMIFRLNYDILQSDKYKLRMNKMVIINDFISQQPSETNPYNATLELIKMIEDSCFIQIPSQPLISYNPNIF